MKRIKTLMILYITLCAVVCAQTDNNMSIMSPETASLGKFGSYPVSYHSGSVDISVPLYTFKSNKIKVPIYISYDASGFVPNRESGKVGVNWTLYAGGAITRKVNGVPDDFKKNDFFGYHGHWCSMKQFGHHFINEQIRTLTNTGSYLYETSPDIFSFNFGEHHGQFVIGREEQPCIDSDRSYKIDLANFAIQGNDVSVKVSTIRITADDGTIYTFGGNINALEFSIQKKYDHSGKAYERQPIGVINGFYLTKIETVDGNIVNFLYRTANLMSGDFVDDVTILKQGYHYDYILLSGGLSYQCNL